MPLTRCVKTKLHTQLTPPKVIHRLMTSKDGVQWISCYIGALALILF